MRKIRSLKREVLRNEELADAGLPAKILFMGLIIAVADDDGRFKASPRYIKQEVFPYDSVTEEQIGELLAVLTTEKFIGLYAADGRKYGVLPNFKKHQWIAAARYEPSELPTPPELLLSRLKTVAGQSNDRHPTVTGQSNDNPSRARPDRNGKDRKGEEEASPNGDAHDRLKALQDTVWKLWKTSHQGASRFDFLTIKEWLVVKPYPVEFWQWAIPQIPSDTKAFVRLTTPAAEGKRVGWLEEKFIGWRESRDVAMRPTGELRPLGQILQEGGR